MLVTLQLVAILIASACYVIGPKWWQHILRFFRRVEVLDKVVNDRPVASSPLARSVSRLPTTTRGELACLLRLEDLVQLSAVQRTIKAKFWECVEVWQRLAARRGVPIPPTPSARLARRAVRHATFHLDGVKLRSLGPRATKDVLAEATLMLHGLMPEDVTSDKVVDVEYIVFRSEKALNDFDPENRAAAKTAEDFMEVVHRVLYLLEEPLVERLEHAYNSTVQLHDLMMSAMKSHLRSQIQSMQEDMWEEPVRPVKGSSAPKVPELGPLERKRLRKEADLRGSGAAPTFDWRGFKVSGGSSM